MKTDFVQHENTISFSSFLVAVLVLVKLCHPRVNISALVDIITKAFELCAVGWLRGVAIVVVVTVELSAVINLIFSGFDVFPLSILVQFYASVRQPRSGTSERSCTGGDSYVVRNSVRVRSETLQTGSVDTDNVLSPNGRFLLRQFTIASLIGSNESSLGFFIFLPALIEPNIST